MKKWIKQRGKPVMPIDEELVDKMIVKNIESNKKVHDKKNKSKVKEDDN